MHLYHEIIQRHSIASNEKEVESNKIVTNFIKTISTVSQFIIFLSVFFVTVVVTLMSRACRKLWTL